MWASRRVYIVNSRGAMKVKIGREKRAASGDPVSNRAGASAWRSMLRTSKPNGHRAHTLGPERW
jgi:hypothetical protein